MAHQPEPMDVECMDSDFDNKENTFHHNVSSTEKGYEELDVSELNMKLRYSMTPASSPMSKSYSACPDSRYLDTGETPHYSIESTNLTRSLNSMMTKNDNVNKSLRTLPLQSLPTEQFADGNGNASVLRQLDSTEDGNITVTISETNDIDENVSLPSSSSSALHTPEATTPTKEIKDGASPIMRGLKSVLNMFRSSTSPIPPVEGENTVMNQEILSSAEVTISQNAKSQAVASTPIPTHKSKDSNTSKRSSPYKDSIVFNDDLEKELNWKEEKTDSSPEKMAFQKLFLQNSKTCPEDKTTEVDLCNSNTENNFQSIIEYMDVSNNGSIIQDKTLTEQQLNLSHEVSTTVESDSEFVDCETTFPRNESYVLDVKSIQEKISPKPNLNETKHISYTTKNTEFMDCDSTFSKNESYVLDIKEIQEKIFVEPNLDETKHVACTIENISTLNQSIDQDLKLDMTVPSYNPDYSLATTEILAELEKLEKNESGTNKQNVPSDIDTKNQTYIHEIITEEKDVTKQQVDIPEVETENGPLDETNLEQKNEVTESQENQLNITKNNYSELEVTLKQEQTVDIMPAITPKILDALGPVVDTVQCTKCSTESEIKILQPQEVNLIQDNSNNISEVVVENLMHNMTADQTLKINIISNKTEDKNINDLELTSQESTKTSTTIPNNIVEIVPSEIPNMMKNDVKSLDILNVIQNDIMPVEVVNCSLKDVPAEVVSVALNDAIPERVEMPTANLPLIDEVIEPIKTLEVTNNITEILTTEVETPNNPSDTPLPDDDIDKEDVVSEVPVTSSETALAITSDAITALSEIKCTETGSENIVDTLSDYKTNNASILTQTSDNLVFEPPTPENTDSKSVNVKSINIETQVISRDVVLREFNNLTLKTGCHTLPSKTTNLNSTASENTPNTLPGNEILENNMLNKIGLSPNTTLNESNDISSGNVTQIIDYSHLNKNIVTIDKLANVQNTSQIEPMDISLNESLNLTHELPDLVNQTIVLAEENVQIPVFANYTVDEVIQVELALNSDFEADSKTVFVESSSVNYNVVVPEANLPVNDLKPPASGSENNEAKNVAMNVSDDQPPRVFTNIPDFEPIAVEGTTLDEEIIMSANNSPYVSLMSGVETVQEKIEDPDKVEDAFEEIENTFVTKTNVASSPPITSKGYNFNFDEIDDPFATKTKMRLSPPLDTPPKPIDIENEKDKQFKVPNKGVVNRRKSQPPERKKPLTLKKKFNTTFDAKSTRNSPTNKIDNTVLIAANEIIDTFSTTQTQEENLNKSGDKKEVRKEDCQTKPKIENMSEHPLLENTDNKSSIDSVYAVSSDLKTTSSSEQSAYYSAGASSTESVQSKNVFNLPEIDDVHFNPFATKSKMRQSPPPDAVIDNPFATRPKIRSSPDVSIIDHSQLDVNRTVTFNESKLAKNIEDEDKMETELMEKDTSANITATTSSSRVTDDQNLTTREVHTEDEDTIEGPFLEDGDDIDKFTDFAVDNDNMQFNELQATAQVNEDNLDGELFIDAEAYEFLINQNKSNVVAESGKESLFLKFDPLFAKRISSDGVLAALNKTQKKQSTPTKPSRPSLRNEASPIAGPSTLNVTFEGDLNVSQESNDDANNTVTKPMMVVNPALNPVVTPRNKPITPVRSNRRSITFTSPAIAVIDRLLSMSANNSVLGHDSTIQSNGDQTEADLALTQLRELLAEKEISVYNLRSESKELKDRLSTMESQVRNLELDGQERLKKINELNERLAEKTKINRSMAAVVEEYERTIASLIADIEQDKKRNAEEKIRLIEERDEQTVHLASMEVSFSDLHSKYEKSKQVILTCKANEDVYKKTIQDFQEQVTKMQTNYEMLKQHATAKLNHANQELEKINRSHEAEVVKLNAMIKRNHLLATSLQETLAQKTKANDELTAICDELINKVGSSK